jgi:hypothetical protein
MPEPTSELIAIAKLNGDFRKNYGKLIGAVLYLRSLNAARGRPLMWNGLLFGALSATVAWLERHMLSWLRF